MKNYGAKKATEFTKKQISVIYRLAKEGELKVQRGMISMLYDLADYYGYDDNRSVENDETVVLGILDSVFSNDLEEAQKKIDRFQESTWSLLSNKAQAKWNKEFL